MLDNCIHKEVVNLCLRESKITTVGNEDVISSLGFDHSVHYFFQMVHLLLSVVILVVFLLEVNVIVVVLVESKAFWPAVVSTLLRHDN